MEKEYKFCGQKLKEPDLRQALDDSLSLLIEASNAALNGLLVKDTQDFIKENEKFAYKSTIGKKMIEFMNNSWDKEMNKEREKNEKAIAENDLDFFAKDVESAIKVLPKLNKSIQSLCKQASDALENDDTRYACEIFKYIQRSMIESKEYYEKQKEYNQKYLESESEME